MGPGNPFPASKTGWGQYFGLTMPSGGENRVKMGHWGAFFGLFLPIGPPLPTARRGGGVGGAIAGAAGLVRCQGRAG